MQSSVKKRRKRKTKKSSAGNKEDKQSGNQSKEARDAAQRGQAKATLINCKSAVVKPEISQVKTEPDGECSLGSANANARVGDRWGSVTAQQPKQLVSKVEIKHDPDQSCPQTVLKVEATEHLAPALKKRVQPVQVKEEPWVKIKQEPLEEVVPAKRRRRI